MNLEMRKPEVLAPAGGWECAKAAVENGADAIYFGVGRFNARVRADNFVADDLPKLMRFLHRRGVRGYVTFNTLIFSNELEEAEKELNDMPVIAQLQETRQAFTEMMEGVNRILRLVITGEPEQGGCTGSCATCGGCHH